jgi:FHA domain
MSKKRSVQFKVLKGDNVGDVITLTEGTCRLVGRHLAENETVMLGLDGNRLLDANEVAVFDTQLNQAMEQPKKGLSAFQRGADIIFSDESISRAHAMIFLDNEAPGVVDLASTNGTHVNDRATTAGTLKAGDKVKFGKTVLEVGA